MTTQRDLKNIADAVAESFPSLIQTIEWERLRDTVDRASHGDLDCIQLDIVTDMVFARGRRAASQNCASK